MDRFAVFQQDNAQIFPTSLPNPPPSLDASVALDNLLQRGGDDSFDPFEPDVPPIRSFMGMQEVLGKSLEVMIRKAPERVQISLRAVGCLLSFCLDFALR